MSQFLDAEPFLDVQRLVPVDVLRPVHGSLDFLTLQQAVPVAVVIRELGPQHLFIPDGQELVLADGTTWLRTQAGREVGFPEFLAIQHAILVAVEGLELLVRRQLPTLLFRALEFPAGDDLVPVLVAYLEESLLVHAGRSGCPLEVIALQLTVPVAVRLPENLLRPVIDRYQLLLDPGSLAVPVEVSRLEA
ncbi:MAG: hypothetical protein VKP72_02100 [bacterium]|nr:hypothetical protein [bacterium]